MKLSVVILAAGKGTRMLSELPKVLHQIGGKCMLSHVVAAAKALNPEQIIIVHGDNKDIMQAHLNDPQVLWAHQKEQKGTGDAVAAAMPLVSKGNRVLSLVGDVPLIEPATLRRLHDGTPAQALGLLTATVDNPHGLGRILRNDSNEVEAIKEQKDATPEQAQIKEINTGIFLLPYQHLQSWLPRLSNNNAQQEYYLTDVVQMAVHDGVAIHTEVPSRTEEILGINNRAQLVAAERSYQLKIAAHFLEEGVLIIDPARFDVRGELHAGLDVTIDINCVIEGQVTLGNQVKIGPNCILKNCHIEDGAQVLSHSHIEGAHIGQGATVGPFARIRPGTKLAQQARVGNFVEVKNAQIGPGSKVNHLTYLGDAIIGKSVNIGAGTITCNYDGASKHQTTIEDGAHIGSNCSLVAPVHVGEGATIAASSILTKDAPAHQLTLTHRLEQRSLSWQRPEKEKNNQKEMM